MDIVYDILAQSFLFLLWIGSVVAVLLGIGMLAAPQPTLKLNRYLSTWIETEHVRAELDRPRRTEKLFYRHHRLAGGVLCVGGAFVLYTFLLTPLMRKVSAIVTNDVMGLLEAFSALLVIGSVLAILIGIIVFTKPSLLRDIEEAANRWVATDGVLKFFNKAYPNVDDWAMRNRKATGAFLVAGGFYSAIVLGYMLLNGHWQFLS